MGKGLETIDAGSGNVFADLGYEDSAERKLRVQLALRVNEMIKEHKLTQTKVTALLGIPQPHVSELKNYKLNRFSSERLLYFITLFDRDVEILIQPKAADHATGLMSVLAVV